MNRREFLKVVGSAAAVGGATGFGGVEAKKRIDARSAPASPGAAVETSYGAEKDPFYEAYCADVLSGNQEAIEAGRRMIQVLTASIESNTKAIESLETLLENGTPHERNAYEMVLLSTDARIKELQAQVKRLSDPVGTQALKPRKTSPIPSPRMPEAKPTPPGTGPIKFT